MTGGCAMPRSNDGEPPSAKMVVKAPAPEQAFLDRRVHLGAGLVKTPRPALFFQTLMTDVQDQLGEYLGLEPNWDGDDAEPISAAAVTAARAFLDTVEDLPAPYPGPMAGGGVCLSWRGEGFYTFIVFEADGRIWWVQKDKRPGPGAHRREDGTDTALFTERLRGIL